MVSPPKRIAVPGPLAVRFVTPAKALASTMTWELPLEVFAVRLAVLIRLKVRFMPSAENSDVLVRVVFTDLVASTVLIVPVAARAVNVAAPVQPLTMKVLLVPLAFTTGLKLEPLK